MTSSSTGSSAFTVASVPTAMNAGVSTAPCGVRNVPARARPSAASTANEKPSVIPCEAKGLLSRSSNNHHCITIRVKTVPLGNRLTVRVHHDLIAGKCGDEHDQSRPGQVKVRDQVIDGAEWISGPNEDTGLPL